MSASVLTTPPARRCGAAMALFGLVAGLLGTGCPEAKLHAVTVEVVVLQDSLTFGPVGPGVEVTRQLEFRNVGRAPARVSIEIQQPFSVEERFVGVPAGATRAVPVRFEASKRGVWTQLARLTVDDEAHPPLTLTLRAEAVDESVCPAASQCEMAEFDPATGTCALAYGGEGEPCVDECLSAPVCQSGVCTGSPKPCDDGIHCTADSCDPTRGCVSTPLGPSCQTGDPSCLTQACDPQGVCTSSWKEDGAWCGVADCNQAFFCRTGRCEGEPRDAKSLCDYSCTAGCAFQELTTGGGVTVLVAGNVWARGSNRYGSLGNPSAPDWTDYFVRALVPEPAVSLACDVGSCCAVGLSGEVYCWGGNAVYSQDSDGNSVVYKSGYLSAEPSGAATILEPTRVVGVPKAKSITTNFLFTCIVARDDSVWCWGYSGLNGFCRDQRSGEYCPPFRLSTPPARKVAIAEHVYVLDVYGDVHYFGQIPKHERTTSGPVPVHEVHLPEKVVDIQNTSSLDSVILMDTAGVIYRYHPTGYPPLYRLESWVQGATRIAYTYDGCTTWSDGLVRCSGANDDGMLGIPSPRHLSSVVQVSGPTEAELIYPGWSNRMCVTTEERRIWCWGNLIGLMTPPEVAGQRMWPPTEIAFQ